MKLETVKLDDGRIVNKRDLHKYEQKPAAKKEPEPKKPAAKKKGG